MFAGEVNGIVSLKNDVSTVRNKSYLNILSILILSILTLKDFLIGNRLQLGSKFLEQAITTLTELHILQKKP